VILIKLKLKSTTARSIGQSLDTPVVDVTAAIEHHIFDARFNSTFSNQLANRFCCSFIRTGLFGGDEVTPLTSSMI
jgi:hypothetical protein